MLITLGEKIVDVKGALFDMDGTILDSMDTWLSMGDVFLEKYGYPPDEAVTESFIRDSSEDIAKILLERYPLKSSVERLADEINQMVEEAYSKKLLLKPYVKEFFTLLKNNDVQIAIVTASAQELVEKMSKRTEIMKYIDKIVSCSSISASKHTSKPYDYALKEFGLEKYETVIFEDALYAISTAKSNGYFVVGVEEPVMKKDRGEIQNKVDRYIGSFREILDDMEAVS